MENLSKIKTSFFLVCFIALFSLSCMAQKSNLFVLKFEGEPQLKYDDSTEAVTIGSVINKKTKLIMKRDDVAYIINNKGDVFELHETGTFKHKDLEKLEPIKSNNTYGKNVMLYFWGEFTNTLAEGYNKSGVVYRGDYVKLIRPMDSVNLYANEIEFEWEPKEGKTKPYYFVLREIGTENVTKIGTHVSKITLFIDDVNLKYGSSYEWTILESKYATLDKSDFSLFKILEEKEYTEKQSEFKSLSKFLKSIGYEDSEIKEIFCMSYKMCL